jgi:hypothetical protein
MALDLRNQKELNVESVRLVEGVSKKGNSYVAIQIVFTDPDLNKLVFLDKVSAKVYDQHVKK